MILTVGFGDPTYCVAHTVKNFLACLSQLFEIRNVRCLMVASLDMKMRFICGEHAANVGGHHFHKSKYEGVYLFLFSFICFLKRYGIGNFMSQKAYHLYLYIYIEN